VSGLDSIVTELKALRVQAGLSQQALADLLGVTQTAISYWESGRRLPDVSAAHRWAEALGVGLRIDRYAAVEEMSPAEAYERGWTDCAAAVAIAAQLNGRARP
jgi:putative transcriptional regulator